MYQFGSLVRQLSRQLESCGADRLTELGAKVQDISVHERCIDGLLDLYKQDQLDNAVQPDSLSQLFISIE